MNVNFPNCDVGEISGTQITGQGAFNHGLYMEKRHDGRGFPYYWIKFGREVPDQQEDSDITALIEKRISVTPLKLDLTDTQFKDALKGLF